MAFGALVFLRLDDSNTKFSTVGKLANLLRKFGKGFLGKHLGSTA